MTIDELQAWILSEGGLSSELGLVARMAAARSIPGCRMDEALEGYEPDWRRLLLAGSVLAASESARASETSLAVAQAGLLYSNLASVKEASAAVLTQLANQRAVRLALDRGILAPDFEERLGASERMLLARRELAQSIFAGRGTAITTNRFQHDFWSELERASWVSASAPTASGKTFLVLQWLLNEFVIDRARLAVFIAPTRALVGEIERELLDSSIVHQIEGLRIASLPLAALGDGSRPTILVFTQERLHVFLNALNEKPNFDIAIIDEVQKIGDGLRGVILQDAMERIARPSPNLRMVFLSPLTENPETLVQDAPDGLQTAVIPNDTPTVSQNLLVAEQLPGRSDQWLLSLRRQGESEPIGSIALHAKPDSQIKRLSYVALAIGRHDSGTLIYSNGAADAEKIAEQIFAGLGATDDPLDPELKDLSDFARDTIHPRFQLVELLKRGVAFHYGNMPTLLRSEIERLFREGRIKFLVCTSTLVEGVNLACRTIVVRGPKKGRSTPMGPHDFWNLAGRAGRWGHDFSGNIVCVDVNRPKLWPNGVPERARYPISRKTETVLSDRTSMIEYLGKRGDLTPATLNPSLEQVTAYLLAWHVREGTFLSSPSAARLDPRYATEINNHLGNLLEEIDVPERIVSHHPSVSAISLQSLLSYFRSRKKPVEDLLPATPDSDDAYARLIAIFHRINKHMYQAFFPGAAIPVYALVTVEWMRGLPLGQIIRSRIRYLEEKDRDYSLAAVIRDTMRDVEEVARFRAPKYMTAYLDVLRHHLTEINRGDLLADEMNFNLYLEFGVATKTLLSLIGLGLSRTTAVAVNEYLGNDRMTEEAVFDWIVAQRWRTLELPAVVRRELESFYERRRNLVA